jgi:undecaprenyl diphosphate synthase
MVVEAVRIVSQVATQHAADWRKRLAAAALPTHVGFIPDGNRRWAVARGYEKQDGYGFGIAPGVAAIKECLRIGIPEISIYGFTQDNTKRPACR